MQQDKFERAERLLADSPVKIPEPVIISSPVGVRRYSRDYNKAKFESAKKLWTEEQDVSDIPGVLTVEKVTPKFQTSKNVRLTQIHGSMTAKNAIELVMEIQEKKDKAEKKRKTKPMKS